MVEFNIDSVAFTSYNIRSWSYGLSYFTRYRSQPASNSALFFQSTQNAELVNCSFHDNLGTALTVNNTLTGNSEFIHNQCGCESFRDNCKLGCGITVYNSILTFIGNTNFLMNSKVTAILVMKKCCS